MGEAARRNADSYFAVWEKRTILVRQEVAAQSAANDAKTARLKLLRLEKEAIDAAAGAAAKAPKRTTKR